MDDNRLLIREFHALCDGGICMDYLNEDEKRSVTKEGKLILSGVIQRAEAENANGRWYPRPLLEREMKKYENSIKNRRSLGECDHPDRPVVELKTASHILKEYWWNGNDLMGKIEVLNTPMGNVLRNLHQDGVTFGISSRGLGSLNNERGRVVVQEDFGLICYDVVSEPSTAGAYLLKEGKWEKLPEAPRSTTLIIDLARSLKKKLQ